MPNNLSLIVSKFDLLPRFLKQRLVTLLASKMVPYIGTSEVVFEELTPERVVVSIPNVRKVRNHIGSIHAAAMTLVAETSTGFVVGMNVPDTHLPLAKSLKVEFKKRVRGGLRAVATLKPEQQEHIRTAERGDVMVEVHVTDETGEEPIVCEMQWAWVPKR